MPRDELISVPAQAAGSIPTNEFIQSMRATLNARRLRYLALGVAVVIGIAVSVVALKPAFMADKSFLEITQAATWADLQVIEYRNREVAGLNVPLILKGAKGADGDDVLGLAGQGGTSPYVWIVLNRNAGVNGIYVLPAEADYHVSCRYLDDLSSSETIDEMVFHHLLAHCT